jgi:uncharacterized protein
MSHYEDVIVPAGRAVAIRVAEGTSFSVIDVDGGQVGDLFAFNAEDPCEFASASHTRSIIRRLFPRPGDRVFSSQRRAMLLLEADQSPGRHDTQYAACDRRRYEMLGVTGPHRSCASNLEEALTDFGGLSVPTPQPFNVFMEVDVDAEGELSIRPATSLPGDSLDFLALMDLIIVLSSCPMDINPISSGGITPLGLRRFLAE